MAMIAMEVECGSCLFLRLSTKKAASLAMDLMESIKLNCLTMSFQLMVGILCQADIVTNCPLSLIVPSVMEY